MTALGVFKVDWVNSRWHWTYLKWTGGVQSDTGGGIYGGLGEFKMALGVYKVDWVNL